MFGSGQELELIYLIGILTSKNLEITLFIKNKKEANESLPLFCYFFFSIDLMVNSIDQTVIDRLINL